MPKNGARVSSGVYLGIDKIEASLIPGYPRYAVTKSGQVFAIAQEKGMPKNSRVFLGIDPGKQGALVVLYDNEVSIHKMPETERDIWDLIGGYPETTVAAIEWIHPAIQGIGKSEMSKLYGGYMALRMALIAAQIPFEDVKTAVWARSLSIPPRKKTEDRTRWKNRLKGRAQQLFPKQTVTLQISDALLIAIYCKRKWENTL